jgi:hypothetical protein
MRRLLTSLMLSLAFALAGCSGQFWGGAATGVAGAGAGYEVNANRQLKQLDEDLKSGKITQQEYDIRKDQIRKGSIVY